MTFDRREFLRYLVTASRLAVVRHIVVGPDGSLWLADSEVDAITKVEIKAATGDNSVSALGSRFPPFLEQRLL
jgi:hypothetical protein